MNNMKVERWSIFRASLDPVVGSEQGKSRPVLIISENEINELLNIVNVIPITTRKPGRKIYPNEVLIPANNYGLVNESILLCHQIRTLDKLRLSSLFGNVSDIKTQDEVLDSLCFQLGIERKI
ncbi:MAG: type II toxin-antitoxin system PemK/MazF family toxin [Saprospiraceae bacterium]